MEPEEVQLIIFYISFVVLILVAALVLIFIIFYKKRSKLILQKLNAEKQFEQELAKTQTEIQEQTLENVSAELHDNIGQLLSVSKLQFSLLKNEIALDKKGKFLEALEILGQGIREIRELSHSFNSDFILNVGLEEALNGELNRLKRFNLLEVDFQVQGKVVALNKNDEVIIFRIFQECINNCLKHAKATTLRMTLNYTESLLTISIQDDGIGFDIEKIESNGIGLQNMQKRAKLIGAEFSILSKTSNGSTFTLRYPLK